MARQIIVPLDQSHVAECAVPYARALARRMNAPIRLMSAVESTGSLPDPPAEDDLPPIKESPGWSSERQHSGSMPIGFNPGARQLSEDEFNAITSELSEAEQYLSYVGDSITETTVEKVVVYGDPVEQIVGAGRSDSDSPESRPVIVIASHGRSGLGRLLLGSVALKVAERATCPVFVVRALRSPVPASSDISLNKVLVALDGSSFSEAVIDPLRHMLGHDGVSLHLIRVVDPDRNPVTGDPAEKDEEGRTTRETAERYLSAMADRLRAHGYRVSWDVVEGNPAQRLNSVADDIQADVIALATHGYSGLKRLAIGSVAEEVLNRSTRPLILVRPEEVQAANQ